jgi:hypothetical protein
MQSITKNIWIKWGIVSHKKNEFEYDKIPTDCCGVKNKNTSKIVYNTAGCGVKI